jgi:hypothetical protein
MADDDARSTRRGACEGKSRTRADSAQFSEMSDKRETGWWSAVNSNSQATLEALREDGGIRLGKPIGTQARAGPFALGESVFSCIRCATAAIRRER